MPAADTVGVALYTVNSSMPEDSPTPSRREILKTVAGAALVQFAVAAVAGEASESTSRSSEAPRSDQAQQAPFWLRAAQPRSRVVEVRSSAVFEHGRWRRPMLSQMVQAGVQTLQESDGWAGILQDARHVAIKFDNAEQALLNTNEVLARELVSAILSSHACEITLVDAPTGVAEAVGAHRPAAGWADEIPVIDEREQIAKWWLEADAIINVGALKVDQMAGFSACLKNISHAVIKRPARYHGQRLDPAMAGVWAEPLIHSKVRLNVVNGLRVLARSGPGIDASHVETCGILLFGHDPVACDAIALDALNALRARAGDGLIGPGYLSLLESRGVGRSRWELIERVSISI